MKPKISEYYEYLCKECEIPISEAIKYEMSVKDLEAQMINN